MERKLAAIFSADVQGYSRLMGDDEEATIRALTTYREVLSDLIAQHQGRVVDSPGDNLLAEFASVVQAVQCAVMVQRDLARRNANLPAHRVMVFRIGINLGDVIAENDRLYGDGVNIAARLEGLAEGGGICISGTAYDQVEAKLDLAYDDLGEQYVKNIAKPVRAYRVQMDTEMAGTIPDAPRVTAKQWRWPVAVGTAVVIVGVMSLLLWRTISRSPMSTPTGPSTAAIRAEHPDKPSIAVLPFFNLSGDQEQAYFADGMTDDLITDLSKLSGLFVIANNSVFTYKGRAVKISQVAEELGVRYVIEGSVRRAGETIRINAQLIDATSGGHLWAETFDRPYQDIFAVQDEVTAHIIKALQVQLTDTEQAQLARRPTASLEAYELFLQAEDLYHNDRNHHTVVKKALALYEQAVSLDPEFAEAHAGIAFMTSIVAFTGAYRILPADKVLQITVARQRSREALARALALNPHLPQALSLQSMHSLSTGRFDDAVELGATAVANGPNNAVVRSRFATALVHAGRHEEAAAAVETTLRLEPYPSVRTLSHIGRTLYHLRQYKRAIAVLQQVQEATPSSLSRLALGASYGQLGRMGEAQAVLAHEMQHVPSRNLAFYRTVLQFKQDADLDHYLDGLRKAGVPEWPFGFVPREEHRLTGDEIKAQIGRKLVGTNLSKGRAFTVEFPSNREWVLHNRHIRLTGTYAIEGDSVCQQSPMIIQGRKYCHAIYRNPDGSREGQNEYISVDIFDVLYFSVQP